MVSRRQFLARSATSVVGASTLFASAEPGTAKSVDARDGIVSLIGDAATVGRQFGALNSEDIRQDVDKMLSKWRARGLTDARMAERAEPFRRFVEKLVPYWMDEIDACARAADVPVQQFVAYLAGKYRDLFFVEDCTSFLAVGEATADGATLFHKNRDNAARPQSVFRKQIVTASKPIGFWGVGDTSDLGLMMMVNEHGLAGSADMGGLPEDRPKGLGVMNPYILRLIAERAERCEDALEILQQMIRDGWYAGGPKTGTHWLFADRYGKGLRVAQNSHEEEHWFYEDGVAFLARGETLAGRALHGKKGQITVRDMNEAATHPDICFSSSISGLTVQIDSEHPATLSNVWTALPAWAPYLPLHFPAAGAPRDVVDGVCFRAGYGLLNLRATESKQQGVSFGRGVVYEDSFEDKVRAFQSTLYANAEASDRTIAKAHGRGSTDEVVNLATTSALENCAKLMHFLAEADK